MEVLTQTEKSLLASLVLGYAIISQDSELMIVSGQGTPDGSKVYRLYHKGRMTQIFTSPMSAITTMRRTYNLDVWNTIVLPQPAKINDKESKSMIKIVIDESVTKAIEPDAFAHQAFYDWRLHENLRPMFELIKRGTYFEIFDLMRALEVNMMLYAGLDISFVTSTHHEYTWLIYSTNDIFVSWCGFTGLFMTIKPVSYYEDAEAVFAFNHSRSKVLK